VWRVDCKGIATCVLSLQEKVTIINLKLPTICMHQYKYYYKHILVIKNLRINLFKKIDHHTN